MSEPVVSLCTSNQLASAASEVGVLAVCDSPITVEQITAAQGFQSWPDSMPVAHLTLTGDPLSSAPKNDLPVSARWLVESPFRAGVVLCRLDEPTPHTASSVWKQLVDTDRVWTGSVSGVAPIPRTEWSALAPARPAKSWLVDAIKKVKGVSPRQTTLLRAGLYLMHDYLDESHSQSQTMEGDRDADLWHAMMHRREPDYVNAKYWVRRVGQHPVYSDLASRATPMLSAAGVTGFKQSAWDAARFVDLCERVAHEDSPANRAAREVQWLEMTLHLAHCARGR